MNYYKDVMIKRTDCGDVLEEIWVPTNPPNKNGYPVTLVGKIDSNVQLHIKILLESYADLKGLRVITAAKGSTIKSNQGLLQG